MRKEMVSATATRGQEEIDVLRAQRAKLAAQIAQELKSKGLLPELMGDIGTRPTSIRGGEVDLLISRGVDEPKLKPKAMELMGVRMGLKRLGDNLN